MTSYSCTCSDPKEKVCHTHRLIKIDYYDYLSFRVRAFLQEKICVFRWWLARLVLGELYSNTCFTCPECKNEVYLVSGEGDSE